MAAVPGIQGSAHSTGVFTYTYVGLWTPEWRALFEWGLDVYRATVNVTFTEVAPEQVTEDTWALHLFPAEEMHQFAPQEYLSSNFTAYAYNWYDGGDMAFNTDQMPGTSTPWAKWIVLHEIGHALGLGHPFNEVASGGSVIDLSIDNQVNTIMSYTGPKDVVSLGYLDLLALEDMYGLVPASHSGDDTYQAYRNLSYTVRDTGGHDALRLAGSQDGILNLNQGGISRAKRGDDSYLRIASGTDIEDAYGGRGDDTIIASLLDNYLSGGMGSDRFVFHSAAHADGDTIARFDRWDTIKIRGLDDWAFRNHTFLGDTNGDGTWDLRIAVVRGVINDDDVL